MAKHTYLVMAFCLFVCLVQAGIQVGHFKGTQSLKHNVRPILIDI